MPAVRAEEGHMSGRTGHPKYCECPLCQDDRAREAR